MSNNDPMVSLKTVILKMKKAFWLISESLYVALFSLGTVYKISPMYW